MAVRAGIIVTGTEVLTGRVTDLNGPWLAEQLRLLGVDVGRTVVVGDRPDDLAAALSFLGDHDLIVTTGGLGPTADDLTAQVVADVQGRPMRLDVDLERDIAAIVERLNTRRGWPVADDASSVGVRKQAHVPDGAHVLAPVGTAPGLVVPPGEGRQGPPVVVLPGPPGELQPMWADAVVDDLVLAAISDAEELHQSTLRLWGPPESELAARLREFETTHGDLAAAGLEVTTCLRDGELEIVTRYPPDSGPSYRRLAEHLHAVFSDTVFSDDQGSIDEVVASLLREAGATITTAESCTAGLLAGRLADVPGSSDYLLGGFVTYANQAKVDVVGVPQHLLESVGAVSAEVAEAMAAGARARLGTTIGIGVTGVAGPGGGTAEKPVGLVHVCLVTDAGDVRPLRLILGGSRAAIRKRTVVACLHLIRTTLSHSPA